MTTQCSPGFRTLWITVLLAAAFGLVAGPVEAAPQSEPLPALDSFVNSIVDGSSAIRGVYVPGVLALRVQQQPAGAPTYVSASAGVATQFGAASNYGVTGLLAHNFLSGRLFFDLAEGQEVRIVYGDGRVNRYVVSAIYRYQALEPENPRSDFVDLATASRLSARDLFANVYTGGDRVTFQTCIARNGNASWGRLFVIATPAP